MPKQELFRVGVGAIILNEDNEVLLGLRGPKARDQHYKWELLGGLVEFGETMKEAVAREVFEEAGIEVEPVDIIGDNNQIRRDSGEQWLGFTWVCKLVSGEPFVTEHERVIDHKWHTVESALKEDLTPMTRVQLEQYRDWLKRNQKSE